MSARVEGEAENDTDSTQDQINEEDDKPPDSDIPSVKNEPAGLTVEGDWEEITNFCERFNYTLEKESRRQDLSTRDLEDWKDWQPDQEQDQEEVRKKSATHAAFQPEGSPEENLEKSASHLDSSRRNLQNGKNKKALEDLLSATFKGVKGVLAHCGRALGKLEHFIYRHVITRTNSSYFDSELVSANLEDGGNFVDEEEYRIQVKIHDGDLREKVSNELQD